MSRDGLERAELLRALDREMQNVSAGSVLFSQAVAEKVGMNSTDLEALDILLRSGPVTAGRLAELTGLTTAAITGVVDRLELAGYARRERDASDRRRVIVRPVVERAEREIAPLFASMQRAMADLYASYSEQELALILDFATRANRAAHQATVELHANDEPRAPKRAGGAGAE